MFLLIVVAVFGLLAPSATLAQGSELPGWVNNPARQFSEARFLMAVGSSTTRQGAKNQAQANLAKIFVSEVEVDESYLQEFKETTSAEDETTTEENTLLVTRSQVGSNQQMKNVQIKEVFESEDGTFYALASMDRMETSQLYSDEIARRSRTINALRDKASQTDSKLERLIYTKQALTNARLNDMLINQRAVLTGRTTQGDGIELSDVIQAYRQAKKECTVSLDGGDIPSQVQSAISRQLQNEGFTVIGSGGAPVVKININLRIEPVDLNRPNAEFMQWALQVEAQNQLNGQWFSTYMAEGREGSMNKQYAKRRAIQAVMEKIDSEFSKFINNELLSIR